MSLIPNPEAFDRKKRKFQLGQWVDAKDTIDQWLEAEIIDTDNTDVCVHYNGWGERWDEWIPKDRCLYTILQILPSSLLSYTNTENCL